MRIDTFVFRVITAWTVVCMLGLPLLAIDSMIIATTGSEGFILKNFDNASVSMY